MAVSSNRRTPGKRTIARGRGWLQPDASGGHRPLPGAGVGCNWMRVVIDVTGQLMEIEKREMAGDVACLLIAPVPQGRQRSREIFGRRFV